MVATTDILLLLWTCLVVEGLRVTEVEVPRFLVAGQSARLRCHFALEGEVLYSLKWWKDGRQFYQYIPRNNPRIVVFTVAGVTVNVERSSLHEVELLDVQSSSSGQYRCEVVAEAPTFTTHVMAANMTIVDTPDGPPVVRGLLKSYIEGDIIRLNCTSYHSRPPPTLTWEAERRVPSHDGRYHTRFVKVKEEQVIRYTPQVSVEERDLRELGLTSAHHVTYSATLGLVMEARRRMMPRGSFKLRCRSAVHEYEWATEVSVHVEPSPVVEPLDLPTLLNTGAAVKASAEDLRGCRCLALMALLLCVIHTHSP